MRGPEVFLGIRGGAEAVLVGHHDEAVVGVLAQEPQGTNGSGHEMELGEGVYLFIGRFLKNGAVAVDEEKWKTLTRTLLVRKRRGLAR